MDSVKRMARGAGMLYFLASITAPFSLICVPAALIVPGNATATAERVRASQALLLISVPISLLDVLNEIAALALELHGQGLFVAEIFWGLWLFPFGVLAMVLTLGELPIVFWLMIWGAKDQPASGGRV